MSFFYRLKFKMKVCTKDFNNQLIFYEKKIPLKIKREIGEHPHKIRKTRKLTSAIASRSNTIEVPKTYSTIIEMYNTNPLTKMKERQTKYL